MAAPAFGDVIFKKHIEIILLIGSLLRELSAKLTEGVPPYFSLAMPS